MKRKKNTNHLTAKTVTLKFLVLLTSNLAFTQSHFSNLEKEVAEIVQFAEPAIVTILAEIPVSKSNKVKDTSKKYTLVGTGLYLHKQGYIVTRKSLVENATGVRVRLWNAEETHADILGIDEETGVAIVKIDSPELYTLPYANLKELRGGSWVFVIGNSLGISSAFSVGNVIAVEDDYIHISANIDPGANGAPVVDTEGRVVGIVSGRIAYSEEKAGMIPATNTVLAVPVERFYRSARSIVRKYWQSHGWIGITVTRGPYSEVTPQITRVLPDSPAEEAGLLVGDVVLSANGRKFESYYSLRSIVKSAKPKDEIELEILRSQQSLRISLKVGAVDTEDLFKKVPYENDNYNYTENPNFKPGSYGGDLGWKRGSLEDRLNQMEKEIKNLREQLRYKKK